MKIRKSKGCEVESDLSEDEGQPDNEDTDTESEEEME